ncbi:peptidoglycan-binding domain-containing protein [Streptomyces sp. NRRL B-1140]|uniref:peptidoglycan-binding domain-containing protein n=1 Tax=Streptomyces sp. NRRL B-1140 TaxID=1415549 RepID=UPI0006AFADDA|nr:peptidoglycan-binding domain-containing protein [Streptomyces sp. NRRL B-1140]
MEPPNGNPCPECGAPRQRDNTPACACTHRAAEALRDARTAQAAAAEDFDPLRIRPYVEIDPTTPKPPAVAPGDAGADTPDSADAHGTAAPQPAQGRGATAAAAAPRRAGTDPVAPSPHAATGVTASSRPAEPAPAGGAAPPPSPADATMPLRPVGPDATAALPAATVSMGPTPPAPAAAEPSVTDLRLFEGTARADRGAAGGSGAQRSGRRRTLLLATAGACAAVVAAAGYASGLFSYEGPSRDSALPDDIRASVPDAPSSSAASTPPAGDAPAAPPAPAAPRPSPSRSGSPSASPSPSAPSPSASPSQSPSPSASQPSATATGAEQAPPDNSRQKAGPTVLRLGDRGPEVTELQLRLRQLNLYVDDADGSFDDRLQEAVRTYQWSRGIQSDDLGVYDAETRNKLESETRAP